MRQKQLQYTILQQRHRRTVQESDSSEVRIGKDEMVLQQPELIRITLPSQYRTGEAIRPTQPTRVDHVFWPRLGPSQLPVMDVFRMCIVARWGLACKASPVGSHSYRTSSRTPRMATPATTTDTEGHQGIYGNKRWGSASYDLSIPGRSLDGTFPFFHRIMYLHPMISH